MTEWSEVRRELHEPLGEEIGTIDLGTVIRDGRRLRWRRRLAVAGTAAVVLAVGVAAPVLYRADPPGTPTASGITQTSGTGMAGDVIRTGGEDGRVFYLERATGGQLRLVTGWAMGATVVEQSVAEESTASVPAGFHLLTVPGEESLVFGYHEGGREGGHEGGAWRITAGIDGTASTATLQAWSEDPAVVVFWFPVAESAQPVVTDLRAFDADGRPL